MPQITALQPRVLSAGTATATLLSLSYGFGAAGSNNGNVQQIVNNFDNRRSQTFGYDQLNRLQKFQQGTEAGDTYGYDPWGNLTQKNQIAGTASGESLSIAVGVTNRVAGLNYDAAGNTTTDNKGNAWTYDAEGRPSTVGGETYIYDGDGQRVEKSGSSSRLYWRDGSGAVLNETTLTGASPTRNIYFAGQMAAWVDGTG